MIKIKTLLSCVLLTISQFSFASEELLFCYELQPSPPYMYMDKSSPETLKGIIVDLIKATSEEAGINIKLYAKPWKRCIFDVSHGYADGALAAIWQQEREAWGVFPKTQSGIADKEFRLWTANYLIFTNKKAPVKWDGQTIRGVTTGIAAPLGYVVFNKLKQEGLLTPNVYDANEGFQLVGKNRLNGYIIEGFTGKNILKKLQLSNQVMPLEIPYLREDLYLVLSKKSKKITLQNSQLIWQALSKVRKRDEVKLRAKYMSHLESE